MKLHIVGRKPLIAAAALVVASGLALGLVSATADANAGSIVPTRSALQCSNFEGAARIFLPQDNMTTESEFVVSIDAHVATVSPWFAASLGHEWKYGSSGWTPLNSYEPITVSGTETGTHTVAVTEVEYANGVRYVNNLGGCVNQDLSSELNASSAITIVGD